MGRNTQKLTILAMLTGIVGVLSVVGWSGRSPQPATVPPALAATVAPEPEEVVLETPLTQTEPAAAASRVTVTFNDDISSTYALLKGVPPTQKRSRRPDIDVWYGQYSEQDYRVLPASPFETEPNRVSVSPWLEHTAKRISDTSELLESPSPHRKGRALSQPTFAL